jgi:MFS family permease
MVAPPRDGESVPAVSRQGRLLLPLLAVAVFLAVVSASMVNVLIPAVREEFGASEAQAGWVVTGFMLVLAVGVPLYGRLADFVSLRFVFCSGLLVYSVGGLICAVAPNLPTLVFCRIVQAAGDAAIPAVAFVAVAKAIPAGERGAALGLITSSVGLTTVSQSRCISPQAATGSDRAPASPRDTCLVHRAGAPHAPRHASFQPCALRGMV